MAHAAGHIGAATVGRRVCRSGRAEPHRSEGKTDTIAPDLAAAPYVRLARLGRPCPAFQVPPWVIGSLSNAAGAAPTRFRSVISPDSAGLPTNVRRRPSAPSFVAVMRTQSSAAGMRRIGALPVSCSAVFARCE